jgi:hypothetical protein
MCANVWAKEGWLRGECTLVVRASGGSSERSGLARKEDSRASCSELRDECDVNEGVRKCRGAFTNTTTRARAALRLWLERSAVKDVGSQRGSQRSDTIKSETRPEFDGCIEQRWTRHVLQVAYTDGRQCRSALDK